MKILTTTVLALMTGLSGFAETPAQSTQSLFRSLTGIPLMPDNPLYSSLMAKAAQGDYAGAASMVTDRTSGANEFYDVTLVQFAAALNDDEVANQPLNELIAMVVGNTRDDRRLDSILVDNFTYYDPQLITPAYSQSDNLHFQALQRAPGKTLRTALVRAERPAFPGVGIFTSRPFAEDFIQAGTNRRAWAGIVKLLFCTMLPVVKNLAVPDVYVRRDVTRNVGGDPFIYQRDCKGCHALMDPVSNAFAFFDWNATTSSLSKLTTVAEKMNRSPTNYPNGYVVTSDEWHLIQNETQNEVFGFRSQSNGFGLASLGSEIANASGFHKCMVTRAVSQVYLKKVYSVSGMTETDLNRLRDQQPRIDRLAASLNRHRNLKQTFEEVAVEFMSVGGQQ